MSKRNNYHPNRRQSNYDNGGKYNNNRYRSNTYQTSDDHYYEQEKQNQEKEPEKDKGPLQLPGYEWDPETKRYFKKVKTTDPGSLFSQERQNSNQTPFLKKKIEKKKPILRSKITSILDRIELGQKTRMNVHFSWQPKCIITGNSSFEHYTSMVSSTTCDLFGNVWFGTEQGSVVHTRFSSPHDDVRNVEISNPITRPVASGMITSLSYNQINATRAENGLFITSLGNEIRGGEIKILSDVGLTLLSHFEDNSPMWTHSFLAKSNFLSIGLKGFCSILDIHTRKVLRRFKFGRSDVFTQSCSSDEKLILNGSRDGYVRLVDVRTPQKQTTPFGGPYEYQNETVHSISKLKFLHSDENYFLSLNTNGDFCRWDLRTLQVVSHLNVVQKASEIDSSVEIPDKKNQRFTLTRFDLDRNERYALLPAHSSVLIFDITANKTISLVPNCSKQPIWELCCTPSPTISPFGFAVCSPSIKFYA